MERLLREEQEKNESVMRHSFRLSAATIYLYASSSLIIIHHSRLMLYHQTTFARRELIDDERTAHLCERTQYVDPRNRLDQPHHVECLHFSRVATAAVLLLFLSPKIPRDHHTSSSNIQYHQPCQFHPGPSYFSIFHHHLSASSTKNNRHHRHSSSSMIIQHHHHLLVSIIIRRPSLSIIT